MPLSANGRIIPGQVAELNAEMTKDGAKKDLLHVLVHLNEEKFLKPELNYNNDNIMKLMVRTELIVVCYKIRDKLLLFDINYSFTLTM